MSEELSEMDEDELQELGPEESPMVGLAVGGGVILDKAQPLANSISRAQTTKKPKSGRNRKSNGWSKPRRHK